MSQPVKQESVSNIWDMFTVLANLYVQDRQAERDNAAAYNLYAYNALAGGRSDVLYNPGANPVGTVPTGGQTAVQTVGGIPTGTLIIGGLILAAVLLAVK